MRRIIGTPTFFQFRPEEVALNTFLKISKKLKVYADSVANSSVAQRKSDLKNPTHRTKKWFRGDRVGPSSAQPHVISTLMSKKLRILCACL